MTTDMTRREQIVASFADKEYRDEFVAENIASDLAFQIRATRADRGWTQQDLALRTGIAQATLSRLENPDYRRYTLSTLKRLASALDVALAVRFAPFSELADWAASLSAEDLAVPSFANDPGLSQVRAQIEGPKLRMALSSIADKDWGEQAKSDVASNRAATVTMSHSDEFARAA